MTARRYHRSRHRPLLLALGVMLLHWATPLHAQVAMFSLPRLTPEEVVPNRADFLSQKTLFGDWGGLRPLLDNYGINFTLNQTSGWFCALLIYPHLA